MSDDRRASVVVIALLGNPFSPRYARARAGGAAHALDHSAMNVAVDAPGLRRWSLTERPRAAVDRSEDALRIGTSVMHRRADGSVVVDVDERCAPWGSRMRGRVVLRPTIALDRTVAIDGEGTHVWSPRIPLARVEVDLVEPRLAFRGTGYLDENAGRTALDQAFAQWSWSRVAGDDQVAIAYDVELRSGRPLSHGLRITRDEARPLLESRLVALGRTRFGLPRTARVEPAAACRVVRTLEDGPFYARSVIQTSLAGAPACGVHETVSLDRFASRWVRFLLPFRMRIEAA